MRAALRISDPGDARAAEVLLRGQGYDIAGPGHCGPVNVLVVDEWTAEQDPHVVAARATGARITVLAGLILDGTDMPVVGITGTAGKTSTSRALAHILRECGCRVAISHTARSGNAWPDHSLVGRAGASDVLVAELTSTHLCHMDSLRLDVGVVTMVAPDHVELHGSLERYVAAKVRLTRAVVPGGPLVLPSDDPGTLAALGISDAPEWAFGGGRGRYGAFARGAEVMLMAPSDEAPGHIDAVGSAARATLAAAAAALAFGMRPQDVAQAMRSVPVAPHRMATRQIAGGVTFIDNSMAATPAKLRQGLSDAPDGPLVLVLGGNDAPAGMTVHASPEERELLVQALGEARARADYMVAFGPAARAVTAVVTVDRVEADVASALEAASVRCTSGSTLMVAPMFPMSPHEREFVAGYSPGS